MRRQNVMRNGILTGLLVATVSLGGYQYHTVSELKEENSELRVDLKDSEKRIEDMRKHSVAMDLEIDSLSTAYNELFKVHEDAKKVTDGKLVKMQAELDKLRKELP